MKYTQIDIDLTHEAIEPALSKLLEIGISDTVVQDPLDIDDLINKKNQYDWDYIDDSVLDMKNQSPKVTIYLEGVDEGLSKVAEIKQAMAQLKVELGSLEVTYQILDDADWKDNWKEYFKPSKISEKIVVKPTWYDYELQPGELLVEIDPGMAFGTGTHETTSLCVKMMEKYMKPSDKVLDVGCGSGILSIVGALLGSRDILGVEIDPVAVEVAKENVELNGVSDIVKIQEGDLTKGLDYKADLVVANLMADLVMLLSKDVMKHMTPGGIYISSGILNEKVAAVSEVIEEAGFEIVEVRADGMWSVIVARA